MIFGDFAGLRFFLEAGVAPRGAASAATPPPPLARSLPEPHLSLHVRAHGRRQLRKRRRVHVGAVDAREARRSWRCRRRRRALLLLRRRLEQRRDRHGRRAAVEVARG